MKVIKYDNMKKDFTNAAADVFVSKMTAPAAEATQAEPKRRRRAAATEPKDTKHNGAGEERVTLYIDTDALEKLRTIAWTNKRKFKDVVAEAVRDYVQQYEQEHGDIVTR